MLIFLKTIHTIIWVIMTASNFVAFYFAFNGIYDYRFWIPAGILILEIVTVFINKWSCPLTPITAKYTDDRKPNFDIYLPLWLARYNKEIFSAIILIEILIVILNK